MKKCLVCANDIKDNDIVVVVVLAKYHPKDDTSYQLEAFNQTLLSHKDCPERPINA